MTDRLLAAARAARTQAFAPYSQFAVGAALESADGQIFPGCNVESASYGLTICAERNALFRAICDGARSFVRIVVVTDTETPTPPCGACRQLLWEFAPEAEVLLVNLRGDMVQYTVRELMPGAFDRHQLPPRRH
ncbi:MAG: cytidine deaminase [Gemmataceae bacterium]|nr:cytidine deaminase [Gemmata sp.]MDW8196871.1 cytidine deaminase [Gemmataceae bacterium]